MSKSKQMLAALADQDLTAAYAYFDQALAEDDQETLLDLGAYLESIGFLDQARQIYQQLVADFPDLNLNLAQIAAEDGDMEAAFLYLDQIDTGSAFYVDSLVVMADLYDAEGLTDVARDKLALAYELTQEPLLQFGLAELELSLGNNQAAISHYQQLDGAEFLETTGTVLAERLGKAYAGLGQFEEAVTYLEQALEEAYDDQTAFELAAILYDQEDYQKACLYLKQLDTINPDFEGYEYLYALSLQADHQLSEALRLAQKGLSRNSFDAQLLLLASQLAYETKDSQLTETYLTQALEVAEDQEAVLLPLSQLYLEQERYEDLVALDREDLDQVLTRWNLAKAYRSLDEEDRALELYQDLSEPLADNPEFLEDFVYLLREYGYRQEALNWARRYMALVPDDMAMAELLEDLQSSEDI